MSDTQSLMLKEAGEAPQVVATLLEKEAPVFAEIARLFSAARPSVITTAARGSSDHAATFFKYLFEISCGVPVASIGPSIASVYDSELHLKGGIHFTVSQSGGSPDIIALQAAAKRGGATTIAVVNVTDSPLAKQADIVLDLNAGAEKSVAATKSFIAAVTALSGVTAAISGSNDLKSGLANLPQALAATVGIDGSEAEEVLFNATSLYTGGRGLTMLPSPTMRRRWNGCRSWVPRRCPSRPRLCPASTCLRRRPETACSIPSYRASAIIA
jgi:glucosamine--fructose-6-phosphate aminotransferase (isomerizing)